MNIIVAILVFGLIIFVHELGHFLLAKRAGVTIHEFSIGMGPQIFSKESQGIKYSLRMIPIGGYVAMEGEDEDSDDNPGEAPAPGGPGASVCHVGFPGADRAGGVGVPSSRAGPSSDCPCA